MSAMEFSLDGVFEALDAASPKNPGGGRAVMFIAARRGEGVSTIVKAAAHASSDYTTYCIDLDLRRNALAKAIAAEGLPFGPKIDGKLNGATFYKILAADGAPVHEMSPAFSYHRVGRSRTYVGVFDVHAVPADGRVLIGSEPDYWNAARAGGATVIVDAPALQRSPLALRAARHMDGVVLVVGDDAGSAPAAMNAKAQLLAVGANLLGIVMTQASAPVMAIERLLKSAG